MVFTYGPAFHGVWEALQQYLDNMEEVDDESERDPVERARLEEVAALVYQMDAVAARLAE
jgi:hypothetical protein